MPSITDTGFAPYAGQVVRGGASTTPYNQPTIALGDVFNENVLKNMAKINGLLPKVSRTIIHETRVFRDPLARIFTTIEDPLGVATEHAAFSAGAVNKLNDGVCVARGTVNMVSQLTASNFAWDIPLSIYDREVSGAAMNNAMVESYVAQKMRTPLQTIALMKYRAWVQLLSDVIDGTRNITSYVNSNNPASTSVTYQPTVKGYCKSIDDTGFVIPEVQRGALATIPDASTALDIAQRLEGMAADFSYSGNDLNNLQVETFTTGTPLLIMETKVLNALDAIFAKTNAAGTASGYGYAGFPTKTFRDYVGRFSEVVEIDSFAQLPTNASYAKKRLGALLLDRDMLIENVQYADVESFRCTKERATGYSYQGSSTLSVWQGLDSHAMLFSTEA